MYMKMAYALSPIFIAIDNQAEPGLGDALLAGNPGSNDQHMSQQRLVGILRRQYIFYMPARYDKHVYRCLRFSIPKGDNLFIAVNYVGCNPAGCQLAEQTILHSFLRLISY